MVCPGGDGRENIDKHSDYIKCLLSSGPSVKHSPFLVSSGSMGRDCSQSILQMKRVSLVAQIGTRQAICRALPLTQALS